MAEAALYDQWAHQYDSLCPGIMGDLRFYRRLASAADGPVLELGCGTGRLTIPIASDGVPIIGLDRASRMLQLARRNAATDGNPRWIQADMRCFQLRQRFGLIIVPYRALQHLAGTVDRRRTLKLAFDHLLPGGQLAMDVLNAVVRDLLEEKLPNARFGQLRQPGWPRLCSVHPTALETELVEAGFEIGQVYGGFDGGILTAGSPNAIWIAQRPMAER